MAILETLSGVAITLEDVTVNGCVVQSSWFVRDDHCKMGLSDVCLSEEWGVLQGLSGWLLELPKWNGDGEEKLSAFVAWFALIRLSGVFWEGFCGVERGGVE